MLLNIIQDGKIVKIRIIFNACNIGKCFYITSDAAFIAVNVITLTKSLCYAMILTGEVERYFTVADFGKNNMCPCVMEDCTVSCIIHASHAVVTNIG